MLATSMLPALWMSYVHCSLSALSLRSMLVLVTEVNRLVVLMGGGNGYLR
jgi:hypothetical protein